MFGCEMLKIMLCGPCGKGECGQTAKMPSEKFANLLLLRCFGLGASLCVSISTKSGPSRSKIMSFVLKGREVLILSK